MAATKDGRHFGTSQPVSGSHRCHGGDLDLQQKETERDFRTQLLWCVGPAGVGRGALGGHGGWLSLVEATLPSLGLFSMTSIPLQSCGTTPAGPGPLPNLLHGPH